MQRLLLLLLLTAGCAYSQISGGSTITNTDPSGACGNGSQLWYNFSNGNLWGCKSGTWTLVTGAGGGGTVTSVSFTGGLISVATPTTTPALTVAGTSGGIPYFSGAATWASSGALTGMVRGGSPPTAAELSGDVTTSGSNVATVAKINGTAFPTSATVIGSNGSAQPIAATTTGTGTTVVLNAGPTFTGVPTAPTATQNNNSTQVATTAYTDLAVSNAIAGVNPAVAVLAASAANLVGTYANGAAGIGATFTVTATGAFTLDGVAINTIGQRVLLKNQSTAFQNGIYTATIVGATGISPVFTRALDFDQSSDINSTGAIPVASGTANAQTQWAVTSTVNTVGTDAVTFTQFSLNPTTLATCTGDLGGTAPGCQVVATHLSAALPRAQGGLNSTSAGTGILRDGTTPAASELSGDATTSGSNAVTVVKVNGGSVPASAPLVGTNSSNQIVLATPFAVNAQTATYQVLAADFSNYKTITVASGTFTITLVASGSQPPTGQSIDIINYGSGVVTIARSGQNINGGTTSLTLESASATVPSRAHVVSDGTNYFVSMDFANVMTTAGDITYAGTTGLPTRLAGAAGLLRSNATTPSYAELSGDATTSGSNAVSVVKVNGNTPGGTCTNQFTRSIDSSGRPTCASIVTADLPTANDTRTVDITDITPVTADSGLILVINPATAIHLTRVFCAVQGSTNVVLNLDKRTEAAIGTSVASLLGSDLTAVAGGANTTTWSNAPCGGTSSCAIGAHAPVVMTFTSISGAPTTLQCSVDYTVD